MKHELRYSWFFLMHFTDNCIRKRRIKELVINVKVKSKIHVFLINYIFTACVRESGGLVSLVPNSGPRWK